jgi:hypothetical protein
LNAACDVGHPQIALLGSELLNYWDRKVLDVGAAAHRHLVGEQNAVPGMKLHFLEYVTSLKQLALYLVAWVDF